MYLAFDFGDFAGAPRQLQVVETLKVEPKFGVGMKISCQPQRRLRRNSPPLVHNFADARRRDV